MGFISYFEVIKNPMDLSTIQAKLDNGSYAVRSDLETDVRQMLQNARDYNAVGTFVYKEAETLESFFDKGEPLPSKKTSIWLMSRSHGSRYANS